MLCNEPGVLPPSNYYFLTPSPLAKQILYYLLCAVSYQCAEGYYVKRKSYNSILLMCVLDGECKVKQGNNVYTACKDDVVLLNCYKPHEYYTDSSLKIKWMHFDGAQSLTFWETIQQAQSPVITSQQPEFFTDALDHLLLLLERGGPISESFFSTTIYQILCRLLDSASIMGSTDLSDDFISEATQFIRSNLSLPITMAGIAQAVNMSSSHFIRQFKIHTDLSPYEYVMNECLNLAKQLLKVTQESISNIAGKVGFSSASNFIVRFKERVGISPNQFRQMPF